MSSKEIRLGVSPLTNKIYAGTLLKCGKVWSKNKQDVTLQAVLAVTEYGLKLGKPIELADPDGTKTHRITIEKI